MILCVFQGILGGLVVNDDVVPQLLRPTWRDRGHHETFLVRKLTCRYDSSVANAKKVTWTVVTAINATCKFP